VPAQAIVEALPQIGLYIPVDELRHLSLAGPHHYCLENSAEQKQGFQKDLSLAQYLLGFSEQVCPLRDWGLFPLGMVGFGIQ
jgi:hypothetical protein